MNSFKTDFLCASSSFLMGVGSVLGIQGHIHEYNASDDPDGIAIGQDWKAVGQDIQNALNSSGIEKAENKSAPTRK